MVKFDGLQQVTISLTADEWMFIVSGLRDCADTANARIVTCCTKEEMDMEGDTRDSNLQLATTIENQVLREVG